MAGRGKGTSAPPTIGIVGLGLIGTSIALAVRRRQPDATLIGIDHSDVICHPRIVDTFSIAATELAAIAGAELVVLSTPVNAILEILPQLRDIAVNAVILDSGSTKREVLKAARAAGLSRFVGGHPMAGSEHSGPDAARADLFDARPWFLIGDSAVVFEASSFVRLLGATPFFMNDDGSEHDRLMAAISHLPQVVATALMARVGESVGRDGLSHAGMGLKDTTRLAASESKVWESVLATNADALRPLLLQLAGDLEKIAGQLDDPAAIRRLFGMANLYRRDVTGRSS